MKPATTRFSSVKSKKRTLQTARRSFTFTAVTENLKIYDEIIFGGVMKIFLSFSGERSKQVAQIFYNYLPCIIQAAEPFLSSEIPKGKIWFKEIGDALKDTKFGLVCLTPENLESSWIHFESGALFKTDGAQIFTFLLGVDHNNVQPPLSEFQHTLFNKADIFKLFKTINKLLPKSLPEKRLEDSFEAYWTKFEAELKDVEDLPVDSKNIKARTSDSKIDEILEISRMHIITGMPENVALINQLLHEAEDRLINAATIFFDSQKNPEYIHLANEYLAHSLEQKISKVVLNPIDATPYRIDIDFNPPLKKWYLEREIEIMKTSGIEILRWNVFNV